MTRHAPKVFLSSTSRDLINEREICVDVIWDKRFVPNNMENWGASPDTVKEKLVKELNNSAGVILILGFQYGSIMNQENISYTEFEFDFSKNEGLPILCFIKLDENGEWRNDEENDERKRLLEDFKLKIENEGFVVDYFSSDDELKNKVQKSLENNADRFYNNLNFTDKFFERKLDNTIANLSQRYNSEFNVDMKMDFLFDAISKNETFRNNFKKDFLDCFCKFKDWLNKNQDYGDNYFNYLEKLKQEYHNLFENNFQSFNNLFSTCTQIKDNINELHNKLDNESQKNNVSKVIGEFDNFINKLDSIQYKLVENPFLLLVGEAGIGKSHLLAHISKKRFKDSEISILLLGSNFNSQGDIGQQVLRILDVDLNVDKFLYNLNEKAGFHKSRILLMIDGLNECRDKNLWDNHLNGFVNQIKEYSNLGLILSVRATYEYLIPENHLFQRYSSFDYDIMDAIRIYCEAYNVSYPSFPILYHEFSNQLFLKLLFENVSNNGEELQSDKIAFFEVIDEYIGRIDKNIHLKYDLPRRQPVTNRFVKKYIECKINNGSFSYDDALDVGRDIVKDNAPCLIDVFEEENLFTIIEDSVFITFEKIEDYLIACFLLNNVSSESLLEEFKENGYIFNIINSNFHNYIGVLESFAILIPEFFGLEIYEIDFSDFERYDYIKGVLPYWFIDSLYWRKPESIDVNVFDYIKNEILTKEYVYDKFMDSMILLSYNENYVLNARKLHEYLFKIPLNQRDRLWTTWIHNKYYESDSVHKLLNWILALENPNIIPNESIKLLSLTLSWFLSSTNNELRDNSTYALIYLLKDNVDSLLELLKHFEGVNDLYIYERLFAVAYGVALRYNDFNDIKSLVVYVYDEIFCQNNNYTHILLRDYARSIVRYGKHLNEDLEIDESKLWMKSVEEIFEVPTNEEMEDIDNKVFNGVIDGYSHIYHSMHLKAGDFGRYIFDSSFDYWKDEINIENLQKIALKQVFDLYDIELYGEFDNLENQYRWDRHYSKTERIGKKYQWIVFYNMLGIVSEKYKLKYSWTNDNEHFMRGAWEVDARNFDPSINFKNNMVKIDSITDKFDIDSENENWSETIEDLINIGELLVQNILDDEWLLLFSQINWDNSDDFNFNCYRDKSFYIDCKCILVKKEDKNIILNKLKYEKMSDIYMDHNRLYQVFDREYSWSKSFDDLSQNEEFQYILYRNCGEYDETHLPIDENVYEIKQTTEYVDFNNFKPSKLLFDNLNLKYGKKDNILYSNENEPVVIDLSTNEDFIYQILIKKDYLISFLNDNGFDVIWLVSGNKLSYENGTRVFKKDLHLNGLYQLIDGQISGKLDFNHYSYKYIVNKETGEIHLNSCEFVEELSERSYLGFDAVRDALNEGFSLCPNCMGDFKII